jgi:hypothetical protein
VLSDDDATVLAAATPILRPSDLALASNPSLAWHVDIHLSGTNMPRGRGLDGHALAATVDEQYETWIRTGNRAVSFDSRKWDFVPAGANLEQRLARPRIRFLSLLAWCRRMAAQAGYDIGWSDAGRRARLLERMWGGRRELITDFATDLTQLTELFNRTGKSTPSVYPKNEGVFVRGVGGFLNFDGLRGVLAPADSPVEPADEANGKSEGTETEAEVDLEQSRLNLIARKRIDSYVRRGIIRRGLLLVCGTCDQVNFIPVGELGQRNDCTRCGA